MSAGDPKTWTLIGVGDMPATDLLFKALENLSLAGSPITRFVIPSQRDVAGGVEFELRLTVVHGLDVAKSMASAAGGAPTTPH